MAQFRDKKITLTQLMHEMCKEIKGFNHELCVVTWEAIKKLITTQLTFDRNILILDTFYVKQLKNKNTAHFIIVPTSTFLAESSLNYRSDSSEMTFSSLINITEANLFKHVSQHDKENITINRQSVFLVYSMLFKNIKNIVKKYKNANIQLDFLGRIQIYQKTFVHEPETKSFSTQKITVKDLFTPNNFEAKKNDFVKRSKREITSNSNLQMIHNESIFMNQSKHSIKNHHIQHDETQKYLDSCENSFKSPKIYIKHAKKPLINDFNLINQPQNIRICDDLLGAGIDPLTYDYNHSKLVNNTNNLFQTQFTKPDKAKIRFPCVIDKFARTIGSQLTGAKISTSSVIRIGSNFSPLVRNLYLDLTKKRIMFVPQQVTIKLQGKNSIQMVPATEQQEYQFLINESKYDYVTFSQKIKLRQTIFNRYREYLKNHIPNECVAPIKRQTLENIVAPIKDTIKQLGKQKGKLKFDELINQVNQWYYYADKKAILDYILKDSSQKIRTGIYIEFKPISDWGKGKKQHLIYQNSSMGNFQENQAHLKDNLLHYAQCFIKVSKQNQQLGDIALIRVTKESQYRPTNVLYYMKKHTNHLKQCIVYLNQKWVKPIVETISTDRNWKKQNSIKFNKYLNSVHVLMSNKIKQIVYKSLQIINNLFNNFNATDSKEQPKKIIYLSIGEENGRIVIADDLNNIFKKDIIEFQESIVVETRKILSPECYIREGQNRYLWGVSDEDPIFVKAKNFIKDVVQANYNEIEVIKTSMKKFEKIFTFKQDLLKWCKNSPKIQQIHQKMNMIRILESQIQAIPFYRKTRIAIIDCHQLKKKLLIQTKNMKNLLFETIQQVVKKNNSKVLEKIDYHSSQISRDIVSTSDYVKLSQSIQFIKKTLYQQIMGSIGQNRNILMKLYDIQNTVVSHQLLKYIYQSHRACEVLKNKLLFNEERILKEKSQLEKTLRERISNFQATAGNQLKDVSFKIDSFQIRKLSNEYLQMLKQYKERVEKNSISMKELNRQQEDLKWALTTFSTAADLENLVNPNHQLWSLVSEYDQCMKEWRHVELCNFDYQNCQTKIAAIDVRIGKIINKLKNFSSLKVAHELQNDVKQILTQQIQIIKIFSHPGLKQRHWHLFNKKLAIPGYDLKQISYGRIKMLYDYQKNLKVLMSISNQAAKQYQIQNQKNDMHDYWYNLSFQVFSSSEENLIFVKDEFLEKQIHIIEDHLMRTILIKNSPFSKALIQMLGDWQNWLSVGKKILSGFKKAQQKFVSIKDIFKIDQISRYLPIQNTEFQTIQNIWKSVIKKILEQPKVYEFFKGQKILEIIQQINKKAQYLKNGLSIYFHAKRLQFPRLFFVKDQILSQIFSLVNQGKDQQILKKVVKHCFNGVSQIQIKNKDDSTYIVRSEVDSILIKSKNVDSRQMTNIVARHKQKFKVSQQLDLICASLSDEIKHQINQYLQINSLKQQFLKNYTLTALSTYLSVAFTIKLMSIFQSQNQKLQNDITKANNQIRQFLQQCDEISVTKKDFVLMRKIHELEVFRYLQDQAINDAQSYEFQVIPKTFKSKNNSISVHILDKELKYQYQYLGHDIYGYLPNFCTKIMYQFVQTLSINQVCVVKNKQSTQCIKTLSQILGKYYKVLQDPELFYQNNIFSAISGMMTSQFWINIDDNCLKLSIEDLSTVSTFLQQKKVKLNQQLRFLMVRQNDVALSANTGVFLTLCQLKLKQIPQQFLTYSRIISLSQFSQNDIFYRIGMNDWSLITKFKALIQILRIQNLTKQTVSSCVVKLQEMISKIPMQNLQNLIFKLLQIDTNQEKNHLMNQFIKLKQHKHKNISSQIFQTEKQNAKDMIQSYVLSKAQQIHSQLLFFDAVIVYGDYSFKTTIIKKILNYHEISQSQFNQLTINLQTFQQDNGIDSEQFCTYKNLQKAQKISKKLNSKHSINVIVIEGVNSLLKIEILNKYIKKVNQHNQNIKYAGNSVGVPLKIIAEVNSVSNFTPSQLTKYGKVFVETSFASATSLYQNWYNQLTYKPEQINFIKTLTSSFQNLMSTVQKYQLQMTYSKLDRYVCCKKFLNFFSIYLQNLKSKQIQSLPEFQMDNYIANSFVYSAYWSLGIGCIKNSQLKAFIIYLKQTFCHQLQITSQLDENFLNQENEWIEWQNMKEEFVPEKENQTVYSIWVPTIQNTKLYTMTIKFIQNNKPLMVCGNSNGKSTLLKEISNFQITYNSFLIDLNKKSCSNKLINGIKQKIIYGDFKKNLILIDDVHLPNKDSIYELLGDIIQHKSIPHLSLIGILNYDLKNPSILMTCGSRQNQKLTSSFYRMSSKIQTFFAADMSQKQIQLVFRPYINFSLVNNDFDNTILKMEGIIMGLVLKTYESFSKYIKVNDIRLIVESMCRINNDNFNDRNSVLKFLFLQTYNILEKKFCNQQNKNNFAKFLQAEYGKINGTVTKSPQQFISNLQKIIYYDIHRYEQNRSIDKFQDLNQAFSRVLKVKSQNTIFVSDMHTMLLQRILHNLKNSGSHIILLSGKASGSKTLAKIIASLRNLVYIELGTNTNPAVFIEQIMKILKTGGKIDQCICCLPNQKIKQQQFLPLLNSIISSPQFYESFNQVQIEQIIKSFNSQKKFLKKNVKRSQLIKKIREKFNSIFHFFMCMETDDYNQVKQDYPNMVNSCFLMELDQWPDEANYSIGRKILKQCDNQEIAGLVIKTFVKINNKLLQNSFLNVQVKQPLIHQLKFFESLQSLSKTIKSSAKQSSELWSRKILQNSQKLQGFMKQKHNFQLAHKHNFDQLSEMKDLVTQKETLLENQIQQFKIVQTRYGQTKHKFDEIQTNWFKEIENCSMQMNDFIDERLAKFDQVSNQNYLKFQNSVYKKVMSFYCKDKAKINLNQAIDVLDQIKRNYFQKLFELISKQQLQESLQKQSKSLFSYSFLQILKDSWESMKNLENRKIIFEIKQKQYIKQESKYFKKQNQHRETEDEIQELKEQIEQHQEKNSQTLSNYEEFNTKITQIESVIQILSQFKNIVKTKNQYTRSNDSNNIGICIMLSIRLIYQQILSQQNQTVFQTIVRQVLQQQKISFSEDDLYNLLRFEDQVKFQYLYSTTSIQQLLNYFVLQLSSLYCVAVDSTDSIYQTIRQWSGQTKEVNVLASEDIQQLKGYLNKPGYLIINSPSEMILNYLKNLIQSKFDQKANKRVITITEELTIHEYSKIIFVYQSYEMIHQTLKGNCKWVMNYSLNQGQMKRKILKCISKVQSDNCSQKQVKIYLQKIKDISALDQKMHGIIIKTKKDNINTDILSQKITEVGKEKEILQKSIEEHIKNLNIQKAKLYELKNKNIDTKMYQVYQKSDIKCEEFLKIMEFLLKTQKIQELQTKLQNLLKHNIKQVKKDPKLVKTIELSSTKKKIQDQKVLDCIRQKTQKLFQNRKGSEIYDLVSIFQESHCLVISEQIEMMKQYIILTGQSECKQIFVKKVEELSTLPLVASLTVVIQIKLYKNWESIMAIIKSLNDKKMNVKLIMLVPPEVKIPKYFSYVYKQLKISSPLKLLLKMHFDNTIIVKQTQDVNLLGFKMCLQDQIHSQDEKYSRFKQIMEEAKLQKVNVKRLLLKYE